VLERRGLTRRYGEVVALDDLSFSVREGQMFGFVGPNGAGKTTAMRIVLGVLEPDAGEVRRRGRPVDAQTRRRMGYMPEERGLYQKMRVRDQLEYFARLHGLSPKDARDSTTYWTERLGVAERSGDRVEQLSLGNQQRVQLAAALVHGPELLVLDEPFSGLDPVGVDVLAEVLAERARGGVPVIFSSHQLDLVERLCEAVAIISCWPPASTRGRCSAPAPGSSSARPGPAPAAASPPPPALEARSLPCHLQRSVACDHREVLIAVEQPAAGPDSHSGDETVGKLAHGLAAGAAAAVELGGGFVVGKSLDRQQLETSEQSAQPDQLVAA
jgi:ABC-type Na+ transport system ATPase subunit NatA